MEASSPVSLEIHFHLTNGAVEKFVQSDHAAIEAIVGNVQPQRVFTQPHLIVAGKYSMTVYSCSAITRVDFVMEGFPDWPFPLGVEDIQEITEEEFWERFRPEEDEKFLREQARPVGQPTVGWIQVELVSGERVFVEVHTKAVGHLDQLRLITQIFTAASLYARRKGGGISFINPANIVRSTFTPGPAEAPKTAWAAHHMAPGQTGKGKRKGEKQKDVGDLSDF